MPKKEEDKKAKVHEKLGGFEIKVDEFGEIRSSFDIDKINSFLNENVEDKKLEERDGKFAKKKKS